MINFCRTTTVDELEQIIKLQHLNIPANLQENEIKDQGFVTVQHDLELLKDMHLHAPHVIAKDQNKVVGYALVMVADFRNRVPALLSLFNELDFLSYKGSPVSDLPFFVMGQICVAKDYRGMGIVEGMYQFMKSELENNYDAVITSIAKRNTRSLRAHEKTGFNVLYEFVSEVGETWKIVIWDWKEGQS